MSPIKQDITPRLSRGLKVVFALSLALNMLVVMAVAGAWLRHGGLPRDRVLPGGIGPVLYRQLPQAEQRALRQSLRQNLDTATLLRARIAPDLVASLRADPFDADALRSLLAGQASAMKAGQETMRATWLQIVQDMSPDERLDYADKVQEALSKSRLNGPEAVRSAD